MDITVTFLPEGVFCIVSEDMEML